MSSNIPVNVGMMRKRVTLQNVSAVRDSNYGGVTTSAAAAATVWASIDPISARERLRLGENVAEATHVVKVRYTTNVAQTSRVVYGSRTFEVLSLIDVEERGKVIHLICKELVT